MVCASRYGKTRSLLVIKPIPGSFDWTALSGKHKLLVLKKLPAKMDTILKEDVSPQVAKLWNVS